MTSSFNIYDRKTNIRIYENNGGTGGNGTGLSYYLKYAEASTEDDPTIIAKGVDENGDEFEKTIHINEVNPTKYRGGAGYDLAKV